MDVQLCVHAVVSAVPSCISEIYLQADEVSTNLFEAGVDEPRVGRNDARSGGAA